MAKSKQSEAAKNHGARLYLVRTYLTKEQHRLLRHATAERGLAIKDYVRDCIMTVVAKPSENSIQPTSESPANQS